MPNDVSQDEIDKLIAESGQLKKKKTLKINVPARPITPRDKRPALSQSLTQEDLDALIASMAEEQDSQPIEIDAPPEPVEDDSEKALDQSGMDSLIAGIQAEETGPEAEPAPEAQEEELEETLSQEQLDTLFAAAPESVEDVPEAAPEPGEADSEAALDQGDMDALIADLKTGVPEAQPEEEPREEELGRKLDQSELDALLTTDAGEQLKPELDAEAAETAEAPGDSGAILLTQEDLDRMTAEAEERISAEEETKPEKAEEPESPLIDQEDMDALLSQIMPSDTEEEAEPEPEQAVEPDSEISQSLSQEDMDALFQTMTADAASEKPQTETVEEQIDETVTQDVPADIPPAGDDVAEDSVATLTEDDLNELLAGKDSEDALDAKHIDDTVLPQKEEEIGADMDVTLDTQGDTAAQLSDADLEGILGSNELDLNAAPEPESEAAGPADADESLDSVPEQSPAEAGEDVDEGIGEENLAAAGTVQESDIDDAALAEQIEGITKDKEQPEELEAPAPAATESEKPPLEQDEAVLSAVVATQAPKKQKKKEVSLSLPEISPHIMAKAGLSIAAGLVFALVSYFVLSNLQTRSPGLAVPGAEKTHGLENAMQRAKACVTAEDYKSALEIISVPIASAPPSPLRSEAQFVRAEAAYKLLPHKPTKFAMELVDSYIETFIADAPGHPGTSEALQWKAEIFARAGVPYAAHDTYERILRDYPGVKNKPMILFNAGRNALEIGRTRDAIARLQELQDAYPASRLAAEGKLLLGKALIKNNDVEAGQNLLIHAANANLSNRFGAQATSMLADISFDEGDYEGGIKILEKRLESPITDRGNDEILLMLAKGYQATGQHEAAANTLRDLIRFYPETKNAPEAYLKLSESLEQLGGRDDALRIAAEAAQRFPGNPDVLLQYAQLRERAGDAFGAADVLLAADKTGADKPQILLTAARQLQKAGEYTQAEQILRDLQKRYPGTPQTIEGNTELAKIIFERGDIAPALQLMEEMAALAAHTPQENETLVPLGRMYQQLGLSNKAADVYRNIAANSADPKLLAISAMAILDAGNISEGLEIARRINAANLEPQTAYPFLTQYGRSLLRTQPAQGVALMEKAHNDYPGQRSISDAMALLETYLAMNEDTKAESLIDALAAEATPATSEDFRASALLFADHSFKKGEYARAEKAYDMAINASVRETSLQQWAGYQKANTLLMQGRNDESLPILKRIAGSSSPWVDDAQLKLDYLDLNGRVTGNVPGPDLSDGGTQDG